MNNESGSIRNSKPGVILFDVYDTLLDMTELERRINTLLDSKRGYRIWFEMLMQYCFASDCMQRFEEFEKIARATMKMTGHYTGRIPLEKEIDHALSMLKTLPVHEDVQDGFSQLQKLGFKMAALTNSAGKTVRERMELTGLVSYFEFVLSAEEIRMYKPSIEVYKWAATRLKTPLTEILLVTAHGWDVAGGANAGMQTAYIRHRAHMLYPLSPAPDFNCKGISELAMQLGQLYGNKT